VKKALTVKQPWANLIVKGIKDVENRTWQTKYRGRLYIHAAKKSDPVGFSFNCPSTVFDKANNSIGKEFKMAIIGYVDLVDIVKNSKSIWAQIDCYHWVLKNPVMLDKPIENVKGSLSLWDCEEYITCQE